MINVRLHLPLKQLNKGEIRELIKRVANEIHYNEIDTNKGLAIIKEYNAELNARNTNPLIAAYIARGAK